MKNSEVIRAWYRRDTASNDRGTLTTSEGTLYSYSLIIGVTLPDGDKLVLDYTAPSGAFASQTTSAHVGRAARMADRLCHPRDAARRGLVPASQVEEYCELF